MIRISRYFELPLRDPEISDDELRAFATDSLAKLIAQNSATIYDQAIALTDSALSAFAGKIGDESLAAAIRKSRTAATNVLMDEIKGKWSRREGKIRDAFEAGSAEYIAFYPQGVSEYRNATMEEMTTLLARYESLAATHVATLGQSFADEWASYATQWTSVRGQQVTQKGATTSAGEQSATAREVLEVQLQKNILLVASNNLGKPERAAAFFQQSLLENRETPATPEAPANPTP